MNAILNVKNLCKTYTTGVNNNEVLKDISFNVYEGEMIAIMGPSGSGKSTLLYSVSGMDGITNGEVFFGEKNITKMNEKELVALRLNEMGFVFQNMYMLKNLNVLDNIVLPAFQPKQNRRKHKQIVEYGLRLMQKLGITNIAENDINEVSGGQLQRACICRSMINNPRILFADEPTGALNRASSDEVMDSLNTLNADGTTIMLVTHDVKVAAKCSRVLYIVDGKISGELNLNDESVAMSQQGGKERILNNWLMDKGW